MGSIELSVIILTCNRIKRCHDSLANNQAALAHRSCEWWIVNNGTPDFELPLGLTAPTHLLHMPKNLGTSARNKALSQPQGHYVLMLDDDAYIAASTVDRAIEDLEQHPDAGGVILPVEGEGCLLPTVFHGCAVLFSLQALTAIGGYPDHYLYYGEEYDVAFRLAAAGFFMRPAPDGVSPARHVRDSGGRSMDHILYRLVRNNAFCWARCLPLREIFPALKDTLHRYFHVSRKENARAGFWRGIRAVPFALWRGFATRSALTRAQFNRIALLHELENIHPDTRRKLVLCGLGKFARRTLDCLRRNGWQLEAILEHNPAFQGRRFCGVPVISPDELAVFIEEKACILTGTASVPVNRTWEEALTAHGWVAHAPENPVKLFRPLS
jgi:GT2 family glycosyltransferase